MRAKTLLIQIVAIFVFFFVTTMVIGFYTSVRPTRIRSASSPTDYGMLYELVSFVTMDDIFVNGWFLPKNGDPSDKAVVVLHGYPAEKGDILARSLVLVDDFNVLLIDFRYFGHSTGKYTTVGAKETLELDAAVRYLKERGMEKIGVYGFSMGGAVALMGASKNPDIDAVIAEAAYADLPAMMLQMYASFGPLKYPFTWTTRYLAMMLIGVDIKKVSPAEAVRGMEIPVLIIHSRDDLVVPFENAERIQEALTENPDAEFLFLESGGHGAASIEVSRAFRDFFMKHLDDDKQALACL